MAKQSENDLDAIDARAAAATLGPWERYQQGGHLMVAQPGRKGFVVADIAVAPDQCTVGDPECEANTAFIAAARTDVPSLSAEVRHLRAIVDRVRALKGSTGHLDGDLGDWIHTDALAEALGPS